MRKSADERKAEILATALRIADELGPDRLTTHAVAEAVGLTQPAIFRHFSSKQALWHAIAQHIRARMVAAWDEALATYAPAEDRISALVDAQLHTIESSPAIPAILFSRELQVENIELRQTFAGLMVAFHEILAAELRKAVEAGSVRKNLDPVDGAALLISLVQGLAIRWSLGARSFALQPEGKRLLAVQMTLFAEPSAWERNA